MSRVIQQEAKLIALRRYIFAHTSSNENFNITMITMSLDLYHNSHNIRINSLNVNVFTGQVLFSQSIMFITMM